VGEEIGKGKPVLPGRRGGAQVGGPRDKPQVAEQSQKGKCKTDWGSDGG